MSSGSNTSIDGGGVFHDTPLPDNTRVRFNVPGAHQAVTVYVEGDRLCVIGQYLPLTVERAAENVLYVGVREL